MSKALSYEVRGGNGARNLVLVHGAGADRSHWPQELAELPGYNVYFLDLPGHGRAGGRGRTSVAGYAESMADFIENLGLTEVTLCGHSMGGAVGLALALAHPAWLQALILVGSGSRLKVTPALLEQLERDYTAAVDTLCQALFGPTASPDMVAAERQRYLAADWRLVRDDLLACNAFDVTDRLSEIDLPTLVVNGDADVMTPVKYAQFLKGSIAGARLTLIAGAGHMVAKEKPIEFTRVIKSFLATLP